MKNVFKGLCKGILVGAGLALTGGGLLYGLQTVVLGAYDWLAAGAFGAGIMLLTINGFADERDFWD